jgi:hypothetical protein
MKNLNAFVLISSLTLLAACGSQTVQEGGITANSATATSTAATTTTTTDANPYNLPAAYQQKIQLGGSGSSDFSEIVSGTQITTSKTLKVKVTPLTAVNIANPNPAYNNWNFQYGCAQVSVTVNGVTQSTNALQVTGMTQASNSACASNGTYQVLDFSDTITGDGPVTVTFSNAEYDNCARFGSPYPAQFGCGMAAMWLWHQMALEATIEVDGTYMSN